MHVLEQQDFLVHLLVGGCTTGQGLEARHREPQPCLQRPQSLVTVETRVHKVLILSAEQTLAGGRPPAGRAVLLCALWCFPAWMHCQAELLGTARPQRGHSLVSLL